MIRLRRDTLRPTARPTTRPTARPSAPGLPRADRAQSTVEYALIVPVLLLILLGILEFGFAFSHHITMEYATREGARTGAALNNGTAEFSCADVDGQVMAAVQRVLTGTGSKVKISQIDQVRIYLADNNGKEAGPAEVWAPVANADSNAVSTKFQRISGNWSACSRNNEGFGDTDNLGVSLSYDYQYVTPLGTLMGLAGNPVMHMTDRTIMALNPD